MASGATVGVCADGRTIEDASTPDASKPDSAVDAGADAGTTGFVSVCVGQGFACAVRGTDGAVYCWGESGEEASSRMGDGTFDGAAILPVAHEDCGGGPCSTRPARVQALRTDRTRTEPMTSATQVVCGGDHACALRDGEVWCWGRNYVHQRGDEEVLSLPYATRTDVHGERLLTGRYHSCAQQGDTLTCWGGNDQQQLLRPTSAGELPAIAATGVRHATLGAYVTCTESVSGEVGCAGWNWSAQLGRAASVDDSSSMLVPIAVDGSRGLIAGIRFVCALDAGGVPRCWGEYDRGVLGRDGTGTDPVPGPVTGSPIYEALFTGPQGDQACGRRTDGVVECWGDNQHGTVGTPLAFGTVVVEPTVVAALRGATEIAFGEGSACAIVDGAVLCWGANTVGQLAQGTYDGVPHPTPMAVSFPPD